MTEPGGVAVYVTSHGFGHLNRVVAVLNRLSDDIPLVIRCAQNLKSALDERLRRPARFEASVWDAGAINPPGDSARTDPRATLKRARAVHAEGLSKLNEEAGRLRGEGFACVLCDIPPLPLVAAQRAGIPGYLLANFTWAEIYAEYVPEQGSGAATFVRELRAAYATASRAFRTLPALPLEGIGQVMDVGLVVNAVPGRKHALRRQLNIPVSEKLVYFYVGRCGQVDLPWRRLAEYRGVHFVSYHAAPEHGLPNFHVVPAADWTGTTLMASCDAALAKAGYGSTSEAMASRTPLIYPPRAGFAEHAVLDRALRAWGGGIALTDAQFRALDLETALERAFVMEVPRAPYDLDGAALVAEYLTEVCRGVRAE